MTEHKTQSGDVIEVETNICIFIERRDGIGQEIWLKLSAKEVAAGLYDYAKITLSNGNSGLANFLGEVTLKPAEPIKKVDFSEALKALKEGKKIRRSVHKKDKYIYFIDGVAWYDDPVIFKWQDILATDWIILEE